MTEREFVDQVSTMLSNVTSLTFSVRDEDSKFETTKYNFFCEEHKLKLFDLRFIRQNNTNSYDLNEYIIYFEIYIINHTSINSRFGNASKSRDLWALDEENIQEKNKYLQMPELPNQKQIQIIISEINTISDKYFSRPITTIGGTILGAGSCSTLYHYKDDEKYKDPVDRETVLEECGKGNIDFCKKYLEYVKKYDYATCYCARSGNLECLQFLFEQGCKPGCQFSQWLFRSKSLECVKWCFENNILKKCPYNTNACGYWDLLEDVCTAGNLEIFLYLLSQGCPLNTKIIGRCVNNPEIANWIKENRKVDTVIYDELLYNSTFSWNTLNDEELKNTITSCLQNGGKWQQHRIYYHNVMHRGIEICQFIYDLGCPMDGCRDELCYSALRSKNYDLFNWFVDKGVEYNTEQLLEVFSDDTEIKQFLLNLPKCNGNKVHFMELC